MGRMYAQSIIAICARVSVLLLSTVVAVHARGEGVVAGPVVKAADNARLDMATRKSGAASGGYLEYSAPSEYSRSRSAVVCGKNTAKRGDDLGACKLTMFAQSGLTYSCSGWAIGSRFIATAGHCMFDLESQWMKSISVHCGAANGLVDASSFKGYAERFATTASYFEYQSKPANLGETMWADAGVIRLDRNLPPHIRPYRYRDIPRCRGTKSANVAGFPATSSGKCRLFKNTPWRQYKSVGTLACKQDRAGFLRANTDTCGGHSGSRVIVGGVVVGIHTGGVSQDRCYNLVVRIKDGGSGKGRGVVLDSIIDYLKKN